MQDRYTGDIGDFGKCLLLRKLAGDDLRLAVVWYLNPFEEGNTDGKFIRYLDDVHYRDADPVVYDSLRKIVRECPRKVSSIKKGKILPGNTIFYEVPLEFARLETNAKSRENLRHCWFSAALNRARPAQLIFLDPDNGLEVKSCSSWSKKGTKYARVEEVQEFVREEKSLVLYQHRNRSGEIQDQINDVFRRLKVADKETSGWAISFHAFNTRIYFILAAEAHAKLLRERSRAFVDDQRKQLVFKLERHGL